MILLLYLIAHFASTQSYRHIYRNTLDMPR